jgi:hypothetical protein
MDSFCELCNEAAPTGEALCASCAASSADRATLQALRERASSSRAVAAEFARARMLVRRASDYRAEGAPADDARVRACMAEVALARAEVRRLRATIASMRLVLDRGGVRKAVPRTPASAIEGGDKSGFGVG